MSTVTVSDKGQVAIPAAPRSRLGMVAGRQPSFVLEGDSIRVRRSIPPSRAEDGRGRLRCGLPGERRLSDFDIARAMRVAQPATPADLGRSELAPTPCQATRPV